MQKTNRLFCSLLFLPLLLALTACATMKPRPPIQSGDQIYLRYTCFNQDALAITTSLEKADAHEKKMNYFVPPMEPGPVLLSAGKNEIYSWNLRKVPVDFKEAVDGYLADAVVGMPYDKTVKVDIKGAAIKNMLENERYLRLNRDSPFSCRATTTLEGARATLGDNVEVKAKQSYPAPGYPGVTFFIEDVTDNNVSFKVVFEDGIAFDHPFGKERWIHVNDDQCMKVYDTDVGHVLRAGPILGRVFEVDEKGFKTDFGDPLAGQTLSCEVQAEAAGGAPTAARP